MSWEPRTVCPHCRRPSAVCYCAHLLPQPTRTRVVILQHPREARVPIGTARMAHLMLPNSELLHPEHRGQTSRGQSSTEERRVSFEDHARVRELTLVPTETAATALLFPGPGAQDPSLLSPAQLGAIRNLVVIDGTWAQARKVLKQNPLLNRLHRIGLQPTRPGNYRIRREPSAICLATIEALAEVLGVLEGEPQRFAQMLAAFTFMVDQQLAMAALRPGPPRRWKGRAGRERADVQLRQQLASAVVLHAEVNAHPRGSGVTGRPELLHLVARRLRTGERFGSVLLPRRPLAKNAAFHVGVPEPEILGGESVLELRARWQSFLDPADVLCGWGHFTRDQLAIEGIGGGPWLDLRTVVARRLQDTPGAPLDAAQRLGATVGEPVASGRAGRTVALLEGIVTALAAKLNP